MDLVVQIGTDPAAWTVQDASYETVARELIRATGPVVLNVAAPIGGRLLISHRAAGSVALIQPPGGFGWNAHGWNPSGAALPSVSFLYLPTATGPVRDAPRYAVTNIAPAALEQDILAAMTDGTVFSVNASAPTGNGGLILNGAALPFVVLFTALG